MEDDTAGDPVSGCKWTRKTTAKVAQQLKRVWIRVSPNTVARLLKQMEFSLRVNIKCIESGLRNPPDPKLRDQQFHYIRKQVRDHHEQDLPVISVDTKSRELIGPFHQSGQKWSRGPIRVLDHDFPSDAEGVAIPYGIYDLCANEGFVSIGTSYDTSEFAVDSIGRWWTQVGWRRYGGVDRVLILADCGGSNSYRTRLWKYQLQTAFCDRFDLRVKVCHYPPGASKWNPIEHKLFCFISNNWAGQPLRDHETVLKFIRSTKTSAGLRVRATLVRKAYSKGIKITDEQMDEVILKHHTQRPNWNYSILPSSQMGSYS
jgi:hypothetical protein